MPEPHKRNRHPRYRTGYRVKNWAEYEAALRQRGSITFWLNDDVIAGWKPPQNRTFGGALRSRHPQAQKIEAAIACSLLNQMRADCQPESYPVL